LGSDSFAQLQTDVYNYVKPSNHELQAGGNNARPCSIGNEVDTGFLVRTVPLVRTSVIFATLQIKAMQASKDAAADTSLDRRFPRLDLHPHYAGLGLFERVFTLSNSEWHFSMTQLPELLPSISWSFDQQRKLPASIPATNPWRQGRPYECRERYWKAHLYNRSRGAL